MIDILINTIFNASKDAYHTLYKAITKNKIYEWDYIFKELKLCNTKNLYPKLQDKNITQEVEVYLFSIPSGLSIKDFTKYKDKLSQFLKIDINSLKIELENHLAAIKLYNSKSIKFKYEDYNFYNNFKIPLGIDLDTFKKVYWNPTDPSECHLLIGGSTGGGKSVVLNVILTHLIKFRKDIHLYLQDTKMVDLYCFKDAKQVKYYGEGKEGIDETLSKLIAEMNKRYKEIRGAGFKNIKDYRSIKRLPYVFLVIEELASFNPKNDKDFYLNLAELLAKGRAAGIYLIITTQAPYSDILPGTLKNNINVTLGLRAKTKEASKVICGIEELVDLRGKGHGKIFLPTNTYEIQCFNIEDSTIEDIVNQNKRK